MQQEAAWASLSPHILHSPEVPLASLLPTGQLPTCCSKLHEPPGVAVQLAVHAAAVQAPVLLPGLEQQRLCKPPAGWRYVPQGFLPSQVRKSDRLMKQRLIASSSLGHGTCTSDVTMTTALHNYAATVAVGGQAASRGSSHIVADPQPD